MKNIQEEKFNDFSEIKILLQEMLKKCYFFVLFTIKNYQCVTNILNLYHKVSFDIRKRESLKLCNFLLKNSTKLNLNYNRTLIVEKEVPIATLWLHENHKNQRIEN